MTSSRKTTLPRLFGLVIALALLVTAGFTSVFGAQATPLVLARVNVKQRLTDLNLPIYAHLSDAQGADYALVVAQLSQIKQTSAAYKVLDTYTPGMTYAIAET